MWLEASMLMVNRQKISVSIKTKKKLNDICLFVFVDFYCFGASFPFLSNAKRNICCFVFHEIYFNIRLSCISFVCCYNILKNKTINMTIYLIKCIFDWNFQDCRSELLDMLFVFTLTQHGKEDRCFWKISTWNRITESKVLANWYLLNWLNMQKEPIAIDLSFMFSIGIQRERFTSVLVASI